MSLKPKFHKYKCRSNINNGDQLRLEFGTCHSCTLMACAKFWPDWMMHSNREQNNFNEIYLLPPETLEPLFSGDHSLLSLNTTSSLTTCRQVHEDVITWKHLRITGPLWGDSISGWWIHPSRGQQYGAIGFWLLLTSSCKTNGQVSSDLRHHCVHVTLISFRVRLLVNIEIFI